MAKLHVFSLIPRRAKYQAHIDNMHIMNTWLKDYCTSHAIRFIYVFSFFLDKHTWCLNERLFNRSRLHFTKTGDSVLAKVLKGVANRPR